MNRIFPALIILGLLIWGFLMVQNRGASNDVSRTATSSIKLDDATVSDRCAKYRQPVDAGDDWTLGYKDRIAQLFAGCL